MSDPETLAVYNGQADDYVAMMDDYTAKDPLIHEFIAACPKNGHVLDLGCGPGGYAIMMAAAGLTVDAVDAAQEMVTRVADMPGISAKVARFDEITETDFYDGIWANFSLLHAPRDAFPTHLAALKKALKPTGTFFIGMKRGEGGQRDKLGRHYEYYEPEELGLLLGEAGFETRHTWTGFATGLDRHKHGWVVIHANG